MALRIKSHWQDETRERSLPEIASALAFIAWRLALEQAIHLHCERFIYASDEQRLLVIQEYLIFLLQAADRLTHKWLIDEERRTLMLAFAKKVFAHVQDNSQDLLGAGDYGTPFIARLNARAEEYAVYQWTEEGPSYPLLRQLGFEIQTLMGDLPENRWVIDQVMDRDGWEAYRHFQRALQNLFE